MDTKIKPTDQCLFFESHSAPRMWMSKSSCEAPLAKPDFCEERMNPFAVSGIPDLKNLVPTKT